MQIPKQTCLSNKHYSFLNMSLRSLSIGTVPIVFLKKSSSISLALIRRKAGNKRSRRPNRASWVGHWARTYSPSMSWAWSWVDSTCSGSLSPQAANKIVQMKILIVNWLKHNTLRKKHPQLYCFIISYVVVAFRVLLGWSALTTQQNSWGSKENLNEYCII